MTTYFVSKQANKQTSRQNLRQSLLTLVVSGTMAAGALTSTAAFAADDTEKKIEIGKHTFKPDLRIFADLLAEEEKETKTNLTTKKVSNSKQSRPKMLAVAQGGLSGDYQVNADDKVVWKAQYGFGYFDSSDGSSIKPSLRYGYVGYDSKKYGKVLLGQTYTIDDDIDYVDQSYLYSSGTGAPFSYSGQWSSSAITYYSPSFNKEKTTASLQYGMSGKNRGGTFEIFDRYGRDFVKVKRNYFAANIIHSEDKYNLGLAHTQAGDDFKATRAMATYDVNKKLTLGVMAQRTDYNSPDTETGLLVNANYKKDDKTNFWVQGGQARNYIGRSGAKKTVGGFGVIHQYSKTFKLFGSLTASNTDTYEKNDKTKTKTLGTEVGLRYDY